MFFPHRVDDEIVLTLLSPPDAEAFYTLVDRNREHLSRWFTWVNQYESISDSLAFAKSNLQRMAEVSAMGCLIWYCGHLAGWVELLNIDRPGRRTEIGYWIGEKFQHRGIARRAVIALIEHAFMYLDFALIHAKVNPENSRSRALLEALGFASEKRGKSIIYRLTRDQWRELSDGENPSQNREVKALP